MEYSVQCGHRSNSKLYIVGANVYVINKSTPNIQYLRCRHHLNCKGTAKLCIDVDNMEEIRPHTCQTTEDQLAYLPYLEKMRLLAATTQADPRAIYNDVISTATPYVQANCLWPRCRPILNRARSRIYDVNPQNAGQAQSMMGLQTCSHCLASTWRCVKGAQTC